MSKPISLNPVFIQNLEELKNIEKDLHPKQYIQFICPDCKKFSLKRMWRLKYDNSILLCRKCQTEKTNIEKYGFKNPTQSQKIKEKTKQTCLKKYGVVSHNQLQSVKTKKKETTLKHYGVGNPLQSKKVKEKVKQTCLERYGFEYPVQSEKIKEKIKQTNLEKYGVVSPGQNSEVKEKIKRTFLNHFGVENPSQVEIVKEKKRQTYLKHYGTENPFQSKKIREKFKQTMIKKYGSLHAPSYKYTYQNESFDSSWELAVWLWATNQNGVVVKREPVEFKYEFEEKEHSYYPDFEINGKLIEVKGSHFFKPDGTMCNPYDSSLDKIQEAKHQCALVHNVEFWGEKEMKPILTYVKEKYGKHWLKKFQN